MASHGALLALILNFVWRPVGIISSSFHCKYWAFHTRYGARYGEKKLQVRLRYGMGNSKQQRVTGQWFLAGWRAVAGCCWLLPGLLLAGWLVAYRLFG